MNFIKKIIGYAIVLPIIVFTIIACAVFLVSWVVIVMGITGLLLLSEYLETKRKNK